MMMTLKQKVAQQIHRALTRNARSGSDFDGAAAAAIAAVAKRLRQLGHGAAAAALVEDAGNIFQRREGQP